MSWSSANRCQFTDKSDEEDLLQCITWKAVGSKFLLAVGRTAISCWNGRNGSPTSNSNL